MSLEEASRRIIVRSRLKTFIQSYSCFHAPVNHAHKLESPNVEATLRVGEAIGRLAPAGLLVALNGELGSGKTHLVKGIARGLGIPNWQSVNSPTFTLLQTHRGGRLPLHHMDFYRLTGTREPPPELDDALGDNAALKAVEWTECFPDVVANASAALEIACEHVGENMRRLTLHAGGWDATGLWKEIAAL